MSGDTMKTTVSQLRVLEAVARTGSFSKAAQELGITQPSVSTQLRAVEQQSRQRFLARNGHTISITRLGNIVLPKVRALLSLMNEIERVIDDERTLRTGLLRIGYSTHQFAMPVISRFMSIYPGVRVEARYMATFDLIDLLKRGLIDVAFVTGKGPPGELACETLRTEPIVLMVPADHPFAVSGHVSWSELVTHPVICREEASATRRIFDEAAAAAGAMPRSSVELGSSESIRAGILAGMGAGIALRGEVEVDDRIAMMAIDDADLWASHFVACLPEMRQSASIDALFDIATSTRETPVIKAKELA